jgi:LmbE family N-acetylglucosaminyl deacetylase
MDLDLEADRDIPLARALFVSPHFDDVAFSCGGTVAKVATAGDRPLVVTVFTSAPGSTHRPSSLAQAFHTSSGVGPNDTARLWMLRRNEDQRALSQLGALPRWLDHCDAIYRPYRSEQELFGTIHPDDAELVARLTDQITSLWRLTAHAIVYLPLAVGRHVDHQICFGLAEPLMRLGAEVWHYEDFPYAAVPGALDGLTKLRSRRRVEDVTAVLDRRCASILAYTSQLTLNFGGPDASENAAELTRSYAAAFARKPGEYVERFWGDAP